MAHVAYDVTWLDRNHDRSSEGTHASVVVEHRSVDKMTGAGVDLRTVDGMMGRSYPTFTVRTPARSDAERKRAAAAALAQLGS